MFERFTERSRQVVVLAQEEAHRLRHNYIGVEHLLVGLLREQEGLGARTLESLGLTVDQARESIIEIVGVGEEEITGQIPFTGTTKNVLEASLNEALALGHNYIGTEHVLLALASSDAEVSTRIFAANGIAKKQIRQEIERMLSGPGGRRPRRKSAAGESVPQKKETAEGPAEEGLESVPTHQDRPATKDELGRSRLAAVLGERMRRVRGEDTESPAHGPWRRWRKRSADNRAARRAGSFMAHLYAPWGAGKSSLLNFLGTDLRNRTGRFNPKPVNSALSQWIVVEFGAWEHQRLIAPWWWLLAAVQRACHRELWRMHKGRWLWFWIRDVAWRLWNARAAVLGLSILVSSIAVAWALDWFGLTEESLSTVRTIVLTAGATLALIASAAGIVRGTSKWLAIGSADGAVRFLKRAHDPLGVYRRRFRWLVRSAGRPIVVFIDDLDRCRPGYVVELLEGIQTLFAAEPVTYVVAADRDWLCESFATAYPEFDGAVGNAGRPLGFLFLEKTFQISIEIPPMSHASRSRYWERLMRHKSESATARSPNPSAIRDVFADAATQAQIEAGVNSLLDDGVDEETVRQAAVRRLNAPALQAQLELLLSEFAPLLEKNPRSMKRLMNTYGIERDRLLRDGHMLSKVERRQLALLTILRLRWPLLAEHLRREPADTRYCNGRASRVPADHPFRKLFDDPELRKLFDGSEVSERIDAELLGDFPSERS